MPITTETGNLSGFFISTWIVGKQLAPPNANNIVPKALKNPPKEGLL